MGEKKEYRKTEFLFFTPLTFILIIGIVFLFVKSISKNMTVLNIVIVLTGIVLLLLYIKLIKFMNLKSINSKEYEKLLKEKKRYKEKTDKKENRIPLASTKKLKALLKEGDELNKKFYKGVIFFNNYFSFILFSLYFGGVYMSRPFWAIKIIRIITKQIYINLRNGKKSNLGWRKLFDEKQQDYIYYGFANSYPKRL